MTAHRCTLAVLAVIAAFTATACGTLANSIADSSSNIKELQIISAGHTGCAPDANEITHVTMSLDGSGTWNATCKGKEYLCSAFRSGTMSDTYSCAPVQQ